jgi:hypothetical protein
LDTGLLFRLLDETRGDAAAHGEHPVATQQPLFAGDRQSIVESTTPRYEFFVL